LFNRLRHSASLTRPEGFLASMRMGSARDYRLRVRVDARVVAMSGPKV
jgi:hypothetical protein